MVNKVRYTTLATIFSTIFFFFFFIFVTYSSALAVQCVTLTGCGNFAILGMSSGHTEVFNVQSGIHRGEVGRPKGNEEKI